MAMQQFNYGLGVGAPAPREGDRRSTYDYANDESRFYLYENGAWRLERVEVRQPYQCQNPPQNQYQRHLQQHALQQAFVVQVNAATFTTAAPSPEAVARAETLLLSHLSPEQLSQFKGNSWFEVIGGATNRTYRIGKQNWPGKNVTWREAGRDRISYCAYPTGYAYLPVGDVMLAQKMALEDPEGEKQFTTMACWVDHVSGDRGGNGFIMNFGGAPHGYLYDRRHVNALRDEVAETEAFNRLAPAATATLRDTSDDNTVPVVMMWGAIGMFLAGALTTLVTQLIR